MRLTIGTQGARLLHGRHVISQLPARPGPTHSVFDVIAAAALEGESVAARHGTAMLGFAAGGTVAPLRALGARGPIRAVDLDTGAESAFRRVAGRWAGAVELTRDDALRWMRRRRARFGVVIEDLSMSIPGDVTKPPVSLEGLPEVIAARLAPGGLAVVNVLPVAGWSWRQLETRVAAPYPEALSVRLAAYDNRILVCGSELGSATALRGRLDERLARLGSRLAGTLSVRRRE